VLCDDAAVRAVVVCGVLSAGVGCYGVHPPPAPPRHTSMSLSITGLTLPNGMRVVLVRDPAATEVEVTTRYQVGSVDDAPEHPGIAHLVEHLMYQQTLGSKSLFAHLEDDATWFNGNTTFDATTFMSRATPDHLDELLSIEAVRVGFRCTSITDSVFAREREVVVNELRQRNAASELQAALYAALYPAGHPYHQAAADTVDSVRAITREQACAFADAHYAPGNGVLVVSGNVTPDQVIGSMKKFLARVTRREVTAPVPVPALPAGGRKLTAPAPMDDAALVIAWPLPAEPRERAEVLAIAATAEARIDENVKGRVGEIVVGDDRAPMLAIIVSLAPDDSAEDVSLAVARALDDMPSVLERTHVETLGELAFDSMQQGAIYRAYGALASPETRDTMLAAAVLEGRDPNAVLAAEFAGLRELEPQAAAHIAREYLGYNAATIVTLQPAGKKRGHETSLAAAIHDLGLRRDPADPTEAHRMLPAEAAPPSVMRTRTLPNGLRVVLVPMGSVPTVDIRLVFAAGTADESVAKRGVALISAYGLSFDLRYLNDMLLFVGAGGTQNVDVEPDTTTFSARGVDMHLDLLLSGLRRWVRDGYYDDSTDAMLDVLRAEGKRGNDSGAFTDAWRTALYGKGHPYVAAGLVRYIARAVTSDDAAAFRAAHYTPDNATLVIAGHFDAALADRWIDYLFGTWQGHAVARTAPRAAPTPAALATIDDTAQVGLSIAMPATAGTRASRLVAAAMLLEIADDVRHQLGASYGLSAQVDDQRLASNYFISGSVDSARAGDALQLLRDRIEHLRTDPDAAASAFVSARRRVLVQLGSVRTSASDLAARIQQEVATDQTDLSDVQTASAIRALTIESMDATLRELDVARASVALRGPDADIHHAFEVLGRTPTILKISPAVKDSEDVPGDAAHPHHDRPRVTYDDLETAISDQGAPAPLTLTMGMGYSASSLVESEDRLHYDCCDGYSVSAELGYRFDARHAVGLHGGFGVGSGHYGYDGSATSAYQLQVVPVDLAAFAQATAFDRLWGAVLIGVHLDNISTTTNTTVMPLTGWQAGLGVGLEGGVDLVRTGMHRFGGFLRLDGTLMSDSGYGAITIGAAYRR